jgi:hypothetical protein
MSANILGLLAFLLVTRSMSLWFIRINRVDIPRDRRGFVASWLLGSGLGIFALTEGVGWLGGVPAFIAALAGIFFCALVYISPQKVADDAVRVGESFEALRPICDFGYRLGRDRADPRLGP